MRRESHCQHTSSSVMAGCRTAGDFIETAATHLLVLTYRSKAKTFIRLHVAA